MNRRRVIFSVLAVLSLFGTYLTIEYVCGDGLVHIENEITFPQHLSEFNIYEGDSFDLVPTQEYHVYEISAPLFTDYSKKQRLIKVPSGQRMKVAGDGLPEFPNGTVIAKTFYYLNNENNPEAGKQIIETRVLQKKNDIWNVATYRWNKEQTEADLVKKEGKDTRVQWVDSTGEEISINYHIPSRTECTTCHQNNRLVLPIGPEIRMLNVNIQSEKGINKNQLAVFTKKGILSQYDSSKIGVIPDYNDQSKSIQERGRSYLHANCSECHKPGGSGYWMKNLDLDYSTPLSESNIPSMKKKILSQMESGTMPHIGTTTLHKEGIELVREYLNDH